MLSAVALVVGCSKGDDGGKDSFVPPLQEQLTQNAYADNETTGGFSFTAAQAWTATVDEKSRTLSAASYSTVYAEGNNVVWLKLYNGDTETYSGGAGNVTLRIAVEQNYTGERREAVITVRSGDNTFMVTVIQEGTKQDGTPNEAPVKVTKIVLDKGELTMKPGDKATLAATVEPADATVKSVIWSSGNPAVVEIDPATGEMTAIAAGTAVVTATSSSNKEVSASCTVTVEADEARPVQKMLKKMIVTSTDDPDTPVTITLGYDDKDRISFTRTENFDGPDTYTETAYTYETGKVTASYNYKNSVGTSTGNGVYAIGDNGYAESVHYLYRAEEESSDDDDITDVTFVYDTTGHLISTRESGHGPETTSLTWTDGSLMRTETKISGTDSETVECETVCTARYGTDKVEGGSTAEFVMIWATSNMYAAGVYGDTIPLFGKPTEYLPVEITKTSNYKNGEPAVETDTFRYKITDGYLLESVVTTTDKNGEVVRTETYTFEYE